MSTQNFGNRLSSDEASYPRELEPHLYSCVYIKTQTKRHVLYKRYQAAIRTTYPPDYHLDTLTCANRLSKQTSMIFTSGPSSCAPGMTDETEWLLTRQSMSML
jgi:hypothetical protein